MQKYVKITLLYQPKNEKNTPNLKSCQNYGPLHPKNEKKIEENQMDH